MLIGWTALGAIAAMFATVYLLGRGLIRIRTAEAIHCPVHDADFDIGGVHRTSAGWGRGRLVDVDRCSAFDDPCDVTCQKACVRRR